MTDLTPTPGARMVYLIKRRAATTREELIAHWFANHMPAVIVAQTERCEAGKNHARRYVATLFNPRGTQPLVWDGLAQLWYERALPQPAVPHGETPTDTFQEKAEPYRPWATREYVVIDGPLPLAPPTLNPPFPCTRSGFHKITFLVGLKDGADRQALFDHWLTVHRKNVAGVMSAVGGFRYTIAHSLEPETEPYVGMAELYFPDATGWAAYRDQIEADGMEQWVDPETTHVFHSGTEMVGIP